MGRPSNVSTPASEQDVAPAGSSIAVRFLIASRSVAEFHLGRMKSSLELPKPPQHLFPQLSSKDASTAAMGKQVVYTKIAPLPSNVPRQLALDLLHSHKEVIEMNPLVTGVAAIEAPRTAAADEYFSSWYEITEIITWGFGLKKKISFRGCFHDQPWGIQSHIFAPMGTEMRNSYRIGGNQPGEPREPREIGVDTPLDGLYLREDININCAVPLTAGFVKKEMKAASQVMIDRMRRKAELLDEGKLHAMWEDGKLKTAKPSNPQTGTLTYSEDMKPQPSPGLTGSPPGSPPPMWSPDSRASYHSPAMDSKGFGRYHDLVGRTESVRSSQYAPAYQQQGYQGPQYARPGAEVPGQQQGFISELPGEYYHPQQQQQQHGNSLYPQPLKPQGQVFRSELPGDMSYQPTGPQDAQPPPQPTGTQPAYQAYSRSPQPSPRLPNSQSPQPSPRLPNSQSPQPSPRLANSQNVPSRQSSNSSYQVTNPDMLPSQAQRNSSSYGNSVQEWRRSVQSDQPIDGSCYRNSRPPDDEVRPDHLRFSNLSIQQNADDVGRPTSNKVSNCPVCGLFEGDEAAISHHVSKSHFQ